MNPVSTLDDICTQILSKYTYDSIVIGILVADGRSAMTKEYILNYMQLFDERSGNYVDFFILGYYSDIDNGKDNIFAKKHPLQENGYNGNEIFTIEREQIIKYYFSQDLFLNFIREMPDRLGVNYIYRPMFMFVEVKKEKGDIIFSRKVVVDLTNPLDRGVDINNIMLTGQLFDAIFEYSKCERNIVKQGENTRAFYFKNTFIDDLTTAIDGNPARTILNLSRELKNFRVKIIR